MGQRQNRIYCVVLAFAAMAVGGAAALTAGLIFLCSHAPAGPARSKGPEGRYYNLVYALTPCSSARLEKYEDGNISFFHFSDKDLPGVERRYPTGTDIADQASPAETMLKYAQSPVYYAGNTLVGRYKPSGRKPAGSAELKAFAVKYAERYAGPEPEIGYDCLPGAPFSACFAAGSREGVCFTDARGGLYCFEDPDMPMQRGDRPSAPALLYSLGIGSYSLDDYAVSGIKDWLISPAREKRGECNFTEIKRTLRIKR